MSKPVRKNLEDLFAKRLSDEEMEERIFKFLLNSLKPELREALERSALPHWFDELIMRVLIDSSTEPLAQRLLMEIKTLSFVKMREDQTYVLHERVRERLLTTWHAERQDECREQSRRLWHYFGQSDQSKQSLFVYRVEALYHRLAADRVEGFSEFQYELEDSIKRWRLSDADYLLRLGQEQIWTLTDEDRHWMRFK